MALALSFPPVAGMSTQKYDECIALLKKAGAGHPPGRVYHAAFVTGEGVQVFDVWTSQAEFDAFGQTLMPILHGLGVTPPQPAVSTVHNVIIPPAKAAKKPKKAARRATAKRAPKKRAARRSKGRRR